MREASRFVRLLGGRNGPDSISGHRVSDVRTEQYVHNDMCIRSFLGHREGYVVPRMPVHTALCFLRTHSFKGQDIPPEGPEGIFLVNVQAPGIPLPS